eukprot:g37301.t1
MAFKWFWWLLGISERTITGALATTEMRNLHHDGPRITMQEILVILVLLLLLCLLLLGSSREWSKAYLTQDVLQGLAESPWKKIYDTKDEKALLQIVNLDNKRFHTLHLVFHKHWQKYIKKNHDREGLDAKNLTPPMII